jgi:hypothetical protein
MSAGDVAAVVVATASVIGLVVLFVVARSALQTLAAVRRTAEDLHRESMAVVLDLQRAAEQANVELDRADGLITTAESVGATVDSFSRLLYLATSTPLIKAMAIAAGTGRAAAALRRPR